MSALSDYRKREESITISSEAAGESHELMTLNIGPHHPATHGVLRLLTTLEGEIVRDTKTIIGYVAASVGQRLDVDHPLIRLILGYFFFVFHQFIFWVLTRALLGQQMNFETQRTLVLGLLNAIVAVSLFHFLDKLKERT